MKVLVQWTLKTPTDWIEIDSSQWTSLPKLKEPTGNQTGDNNTKVGWIYSLNIQGRIFSADHYHVEDLNDGSGGVRVTVWNDDPDDYPEGEKYARVLTILPLAPDPDAGGAINTLHTIIVYGQANHLARRGSPAQDEIFRPWSEFVPPTNPIHGTWVSKPKSKEHVAVQTLRGWRQWTEGLDPSEIDANGKVKIQRDLGRWKKAQGTITYYQRDTDRANGIYTATHEDALEKSTAGAATETVTVLQGTFNNESWVFSTPSNEPNVADWPNGTYRAQLDCTVIGDDIVYGVGGTSNNGLFVRTNSDLSSLLGAIEGSPNFSGVGLKLSTVTWNPSAGNASDRFAVLVHTRNNNAHMDEDITLELNTSDSYADGPWAGPPGGPKGPLGHPLHGPLGGPI